MDLLNGLRPTIYAALENVNDTFFQVPCTYSLAGADAISDFMEDLDTIGKQYTTYNFGVLFEQGSKALDEKQAGVLDENEAMLTVFVSTLDSVGLWDGMAQKPILKAEQDYFSIKSQRYRVIRIVMDGFFESTPVLVQIVGKKIITAA